jgi:hypothetical protein
MGNNNSGRLTEEDLKEASKQEVYQGHYEHPTGILKDHTFHHTGVDRTPTTTRLPPIEFILARGKHLFCVHKDHRVTHLEPNEPPRILQMDSPIKYAFERRDDGSFLLISEEDTIYTDRIMGLMSSLLIGHRVQDIQPIEDVPSDAIWEVIGAKRPSPSVSASTFPPWTMCRGNNGYPWIVKKDKGGRRRWQQAPKHPPGDRYYTHDNGARPFLVIVHEESVSVFRVRKGDELHEDFYEKGRYYRESSYAIHVKTWKQVKRVWVGKDKDEIWIGNSMLLHVSGNQYVFIGERVYSFQVPKDDPVIDFRSEVANNDVPEGLAHTKTNAYLLSTEPVMISKSEFPQERQWEDAYTHFYCYIDGKKDVKSPPIKMICDQL